MGRAQAGVRAESLPVTAQEIIRTVAIMLATGLAAELVARILRVPPMLLLLVAGCLLGPYVLGAVDLELDDTGLELLFTLGVSSFCSTEALGSRCTSCVGSF